MPVQPRIGAQHLRRVIRLELGIIAGIENAEDDFFDVVGQPVIGGQHAVNVIRWTRGRVALLPRGRRRQVAEALADSGQALGVVLGDIVGHAADGGMQVRAADGFGIHHLAGGAFHEVRTTEAHKARAFDHDDGIAERWKIGAARDARSHHGGNLRHTELAPHKGIIVKNAAAAILAWEDTVLVRQIDARRVH